MGVTFRSYSNDNKLHTVASEGVISRFFKLIIKALFSSTIKPTMLGKNIAIVYLNVVLRCNKDWICFIVNFDLLFDTSVRTK